MPCSLADPLILVLTSYGKKHPTHSERDVVPVLGLQNFIVEACNPVDIRVSASLLRGIGRTYLWGGVWALHTPMTVHGALRPASRRLASTPGEVEQWSR